MSTTAEQHAEHLDREQAEGDRREELANESAEGVLAEWREGRWCRWCNTRPRLVGSEPGLEPDPYCPVHGDVVPFEAPPSPEDEERLFPPDLGRAA